VDQSGFVEWCIRRINVDSASITSDNSTFAQSAPLNNGDTYTVQFNQTGTFPYHCAIHTYMTGTITVVARNATTNATTTTAAM